LDAYTKVTDEFFNEMEKVRKEFKQILKDEQLTKNAENKLESSNREIDVIGKKKEKKKDEKKEKRTGKYIGSCKKTK
jgi:hypothetical protein